MYQKQKKQAKTVKKQPSVQFILDYGLQNKIIAAKIGMSVSSFCKKIGDNPEYTHTFSDAELSKIQTFLETMLGDLEKILK